MKHREFQAFFSYSHHDARADPTLIRAFSEYLEQRVVAKLTNAEFSIWKDNQNLRIGERWDNKIAEAISNSSIFIILLSPKWIESDYCRKEYKYFVDSVEVAAPFGVGEYVSPLMIRDLSIQKKHFDDGQRDVYESISSRQYAKALSVDFLNSENDKRLALVDGIADDIVGMIERLRLDPIVDTSNSGRPAGRRPRMRTEFDANAHNFEEVDPISVAEVLIDSRKENMPRAVFAHVDFMPRLYVQAGNVRIEFGIRRAILSLHEAGEEKFLSRNTEWDDLPDQRRGAYYISSRSSPSDLTICIDPLPGSFTLKELPLPPADGENRLSKIAVAEAEVDPMSLSATLSVKLNPEGLFIFSGDDNQKASAATLKKIAAIINVAAERNISTKPGVLERNVPVRERKR